MIRIYAQSGTRTFLGSVSPGRTKTLAFREPLLETSYYLEAERDGDAVVTSRRFELVRRAVVRWTLESNTIEMVATGIP